MSEAESPPTSVHVALDILHAIAGRKHGRAPIYGVAMAWWKKSQAELIAAGREGNRSKIGRMARLKGAVETATPHIVLALPKPRE